MLRRSRVRWLLALPLLAVLAVPAHAQDDGGGPVVTQAVQVTDNPAYVRGHSSPQIARNPDNGELVIAETDVYAGFGINVHISEDEGRTWSKGGDPMQKPFVWNSDLAINGPYVTMGFNQEGVLFLAFSAADPATGNVNRNDRPRPMFLARSQDGGRTFTTTMVYEPDRAKVQTLNNRRAQLALDPANSDNVYVAWIQTNTGEKSRSMIAGSSDGGRTFREPVDLAADDPQGGYQPRPAVTSDGVVHAIYPGAGFAPAAPQGQPAAPPVVRAISYRQSTDGGRTWSPPKVIDSGAALFFHSRKQLLAADPNNGNLYAIWYGTAAVKDRPGPTDDNEIVLRASYDGGNTWGDRVIVNDDAQSPNTQHYDPGIAIAPNGRVDIAWYDFRNSPMPEVIPTEFAAPFNNGGFTDIYYASSTDGGRTFSPNVRVSDRMADRRIGMWSNNVHSHYNTGIASSNDATYIAWQDSRNGNEQNDSEDIYFAQVIHDASGISVEQGSSVPGWILVGAGTAIGMGLAMVIVYFVTRSRPVPETAKT